MTLRKLVALAVLTAVSATSCSQAVGASNSDSQPAQPPATNETERPTTTTAPTGAAPEVTTTTAPPIVSTTTAPEVVEVDYPDVDGFLAAVLATPNTWDGFPEYQIRANGVENICGIDFPYGVRIGAEATAGLLDGSGDFDMYPLAVEFLCPEYADFWADVVEAGAGQ